MVQTNGSVRYLLTMIDDYSKKLWVCVLRSKDEVFKNFLEWKVLIENQTEKKIKMLRTDNGLEFLNSKMDALCKENDIDRHLTVPEWAGRTA